MVENAFGLLQQRWRIFSTTLLVLPRVVRLISICACILHNLQLRKQPPLHHNLDREDENHSMIPGSWRNENNLMENLATNARVRNPSNEAKSQRKYLAAYYASIAGSVPCQEGIIYPRERHCNEEQIFQMYKTMCIYAGRNMRACSDQHATCGPTYRTLLVL